MTRFRGLLLVVLLVVSLGCGRKSNVPTSMTDDQIRQQEAAQKQVDSEESANRKNQPVNSAGSSGVEEEERRNRGR